MAGVNRFLSATCKQNGYDSGLAFIDHLQQAYMDAGEHIPYKPHGCIQLFINRLPEKAQKMVNMLELQMPMLFRTDFIGVLGATRERLAAVYQVEMASQPLPAPKDNPSGPGVKRKCADDKKHRKKNRGSFAHRTGVA
ncbi:MAG: hypothetical protein ACRDL7_01315, partial [Gaiellaceae bacterium]